MWLLQTVAIRIKRKKEKRKKTRHLIRSYKGYTVELLRSWWIPLVVLITIAIEEQENSICI